MRIVRSYATPEVLAFWERCEAFARVVYTWSTERWAWAVYAVRGRYPTRREREDFEGRE